MLNPKDTASWLLSSTLYAPVNSSPDCEMAPPMSSLYKMSPAPMPLGKERWPLINIVEGPPLNPAHWFR